MNRAITQPGMKRLSCAGPTLQELHRSRVLHFHLSTLVWVFFLLLFFFQMKILDFFNSIFSTTLEFHDIFNSYKKICFYYMSFYYLFVPHDLDLNFSGNFSDRFSVFPMLR